jgi:hypothetical protein
MSDAAIAVDVDPYAQGAAYVDGEFCPVSQARIPLTDLGFVRSDVTYDVVHVWKGRFFRLDAHLDRFLKSSRPKCRHESDRWCLRTLLLIPIGFPASRIKLGRCCGANSLFCGIGNLPVTR